MVMNVNDILLIKKKNKTIYKIYKNNELIWLAPDQVINIVLRSVITFPYTVEYYINNEIKYKDVNETNVSISIPFEENNISYLFNTSVALYIKTIDMNEIDLKGYKSNGLFKNCRYLQSINMSNVDTSMVEDFSDMFNFCMSLESIKGLNNIVTSNCTNISNMFYACCISGEIDVSNWDVSNVTNMKCCFGMQRSDNVRIGNLNSGIGRITHIKGLENWDVSNCENFESLFDNQCYMEEYNISHWNTSKVKNMAHMFRWNQYNLKELDLSGWNTSNCECMAYMFRNCYVLEKIKINFDMGKISDALGYYHDSKDGDVERTRDMFLNCNKLTTIEGSFKNIRESLDLSKSPLTHESVMIVLNGLTNVTNQKTLKLHANTYKTLTQNEIALATGKNWLIT